MLKNEHRDHGHIEESIGEQGDEQQLGGDQIIHVTGVPLKANVLLTKRIKAHLEGNVRAASLLMKCLTDVPIKFTHNLEADKPQGGDDVNREEAHSNGIPGDVN